MTPDRPQQPPARQGWRLNHFIGGGHATPHQRARGRCSLIIAAAPCEDKTVASEGRSPLPTKD